MSQEPNLHATPTPVPGPEGDDLGFPLPAAPRGSRIGVVVVLVVIVGGAVGVRYLRKDSHAAGSTDVATESKAPIVELIKAKELSSDHALSLPGTVKPLEETKLFARVSGYVRAWHADIGDKVTEGQVLVDIETPELAAELAQARAQLLSARANVKQASAQRDYSKSNSSRYTTLADQQLVSKSQVEETAAKAATDEATVSAAESNVTAMEANVRRLVELQSFNKVIAPFAGTITTRSVERGALVQTGGTTPMFTLVATDPVRIFVDVPQTIAPSVKGNTPAQVTVREYAGRTFTGKVTRSAGALDEDMHTMTTEIQVPNPDGALFPGMYVQASITLPTPHKVLEIPATALYSDAEGLRVATVDSTHHVKFVKITVERDTGATIQIAAGLTGDEQIVKIAVPELRDGDSVTVAQSSRAGSGSSK
jgi:membrane fusion protein (multidrug efflux system)